MARSPRAKQPEDAKQRKRRLKLRADVAQPPQRHSGRLALRRVVEPGTPGQAAYVRALRCSDITVVDGPAGTGKTFLPAGVAIHELVSTAESGAPGRRDKLILCRPAVTAGEELGFTPGSLDKKIAPFLAPVLEAVRLFSRDEDEYRTLTHPIEGVVQAVTIGHMRGRTFRDAWVILDEAQNTTEQQIELFLGRIGPNTRLVIAGDTRQSDLRGTRNGLELALALDDYRFEKGRVSVCTLGWEDVMRHDLIAEVLRATAKIRGEFNG